MTPDDLAAFRRMAQAVVTATTALVHIVNTLNPRAGSYDHNTASIVRAVALAEQALTATEAAHELASQEVR